MKWQSQLVRFNDCYFADGGKETFATSKETVNRTLTLSDGSSMVVRTSGYSNFYSDVLPKATSTSSASSAITQMAAGSSPSSTARAA